MSSISSSSTYSVSSASNNGMSGLVSGMDTDSLVEKMLSGTQSKIDKQQQLKQQLTWKQEMYRDVITSINSFHSKYFDTSFDSEMKNNMANASFFDSMVSKVTGSGSDYLKIISSSSDASVGSMNVVVKKLASAAKLNPSKTKISKNEISGKIETDPDKLKDLFKSKKVDFTVNGQNVSVDLAGVSTTSDIISKLNDAFKAKGLDVTAKQQNGMVSISTGSKDTSIKVDESSSDWGLQILGISKGSTSSATSANAQLLNGTTSPNFNAGVTFTVTLNGVSKQISVEPEVDSTSGKVTQDSVKKALAKSISQAFGGTVDTDNNVTGGYIELKFDKTNGSFTLSAKNELDQFTITGSSANSLGITPGSSNRISTTTTLGELTDKVSGGNFKFTINGVDFSFSEEDTLGTMMNKINTSGAGVKMTYSSLSDSFTLEATSTGANYKIDITQTQGNLLSQLFGEDVIAAGSSTASSLLTTGKIAGTTDNIEDSFSMGSVVSLKMTVNGKEHTFSLPAKQGGYTKKTAIDEMNKLLKEEFKDDKGDATIKIDETTNSLIVTDGSSVSFSRTSVDMSNAASVTAAKKSDLAFLLGLNTSNKSNVANGDMQVKDLSEKQKEALKKLSNGTNTIDDNTKLSDIKIGGKNVFENGRISITKNDLTSITDDTALKTLFGKEKTELEKDFGDGTLDNQKVSAGQDAEVEINGQSITRSSNLFTVNGITMELTKVMTAKTDGTYDAATIQTERDADTIVETFKNFVKDYNAMLDKLNGYVDADATYREYAPLTTAQKKEMSEKEIEQWEEKSKSGLLRRNSDLEYFLSQMRIALYTKPSSSNYAIYDIGIETGKYTDKGKLTFNETTLRKALSDDPESIKNLFLDVESGLSKQLVQIMDDAAKLSSASPGTMVREAGTTVYMSKTNTLSTRISEIELKIKELQSKYETERKRYWSQFNSMETTLSNYSTQAGWLAQMSGTYSSY